MFIFFCCHGDIPIYKCLDQVYFTSVMYMLSTSYKTYVRKQKKTLFLVISVTVYYS